MPVLLVPGDYLDETVDPAKKLAVKLMTVEELLPDSFGPEHLKENAIRRG